MDDAKCSANVQRGTILHCSGINLVEVECGADGHGQINESIGTNESPSARRRSGHAAFGLRVNTDKPSVETMINSASLDLQSLSASKEALSIAIWFAAVTAMSKEECFAIHKKDRNLLLFRYRQGSEQALACWGGCRRERLMVDDHA